VDEPARPTAIHPTADGAHATGQRCTDESGAWPASLRRILADGDQSGPVTMISIPEQSEDLGGFVTASLCPRDVTETTTLVDKVTIKDVGNPRPEFGVVDEVGEDLGFDGDGLHEFGGVEWRGPGDVGGNCIDHVEHVVEDLAASVRLHLRLLRGDSCPIPGTRSCAGVWRPLLRPWQRPRPHRLPAQRQKSVGKYRRCAR
jgi:hypothetical protein